jgi:hypothetical protein
MRIYDLLLRPQPDRACLADRLDEVVGQLGAELATRWEVNTKLEALQTLAAWVQDLVLDNDDRSCSMAASISMVAELLKELVDAVASNGVRWGTRSTLVAALSHFPELEVELVLLGSGCNVVLMKDHVDALWNLAHPASDVLVSYILPSVSYSPLDGAEE